MLLQFYVKSAELSLHYGTPTLRPKSWYSFSSFFVADLLFTVTTHEPLRLSAYSTVWTHRNRLAGGSQSISKCAREIGRTVSQFLNVHGQVSQFLNVPQIGPDAYKVGPGAYL